MTEIERIISKGVIPRSFLESEIRCDYAVTAKMKKIWAVEIDLYLEFARICDKFGFRYWTIGGTLLGAIRHNGYIPWDDDLDVVMPRHDYEKFIQLANKELDMPYFLQTPYSDPGYLVCFAKLRNGNTTGSSTVLLHNDFNQGIFLDIFPLDSCFPENCERDRKLAIPFMRQCGAHMKYKSKHLSKEYADEVQSLLVDNPIESFEKVQQIMMNPDYVSADSWWISTINNYPAHKLTWPKSCFVKTETHQFEMINIAIPVGWEEILSIQFGDYMQLPPMEKRGTWHDGFIFDSDKSYLEYQESGGY